MSIGLEPGELLLTFLLKGTIILAAAAATCALLTRAPADVRHLVWGLAFSGLLLAAVLVPVLPALDLPVVPRGMLLLEEPIPRVDTRVPNAVGTPRPAPPVAVPATSGVRPSVDGRDAHFAEGAESRTTGVLTTRLPIGLLDLAVWIWAVGFAIALARGLVELLLLSWRARDGEEVSGQRWKSSIARSMQQTDLERAPMVLLSEETPVPMVWGFRRPVVLLPYEAASWPARIQRIVLLHEFVHAKRLDHATNFVVQLVCALYWMNPLVWIAARRFRLERERATDEAVLEAGADRFAYAYGLMEVTQSLRAARSSAAVAMAAEPELKRRVRLIIESSALGPGLTRRAAAAVSVATLTTIVLLSTVRLSPVEANAEAPSPESLVPVTAVGGVSGPSIPSTEIERLFETDSPPTGSRLVLSDVAHQIAVSSLGRRLRVFELSPSQHSLALGWMSQPLTSPPEFPAWAGTSIGDIDDDGDDEIIGLIRGVDLRFAVFEAGSTGVPAWVSPPLASTSWSLDLLVADGDGSLEIVMNLGRHVEVWKHDHDGIGYSPVWQGPRETPGLDSIEVGDATNDGFPDIVAGMRASDGFAVIYPFDPQTGRWDGRLTTQSVADEVPLNSTTTIKGVRVRDVDGDGRNEIIGAMSAGPSPARLLVWGGDAYSLSFASEVLSDRNGVIAAAGDLNGDGANEIVALGLNWNATAGDLAGTSLDTQVHVFSFNEGTYSRVSSSSLGAVVAVHIGVADIDNDGSAEVVIGTIKGILILDCQGRVPSCSVTYRHDFGEESTAVSIR